MATLEPGYRYYSPGQLREAQLIDALREAGMPNDPPCPKVSHYDDGHVVL